MKTVRFNPKNPHRDFIERWTAPERREAIDRLHMHRHYRQPLREELNKLAANKWDHDDGARARAIWWNGSGADFINHLGLRMGASTKHKRASDNYYGAVFPVDRINQPLSLANFSAAGPTHLEQGKIPDLVDVDPATPRVWELLVHNGTQFTTVTDRTVYFYPLARILEMHQRRLGDHYLLRREGKNLLIRITSPEITDDLGVRLGRPHKYQIANFGDVVPWHIYDEAMASGFWPGSLMSDYNDIQPYLRTHPWFFGQHDFAFHRELHAAAAGEGQLMAEVIVRAALSVVPEIVDWDETAETFELLVQMDPLVAKPRHVKTQIMELLVGLRREARRHPEAKERIEEFLAWAEQG